MAENDVITGIPLSDEDKFWLEKMREQAGNSIKSIEEAAKQLIAMLTVMQGIFAAVLAFSGIKQVPQGNTWAVIVYAAPIFFWLAALLAALRVFKSKKYDYYSISPDSAKEIFYKIAEYKYSYLNITFILLTIGFVIAACGIMYWLWLGVSG